MAWLSHRARHCAPTAHAACGGGRGADFETFLGLDRGLEGGRGGAAADACMTLQRTRVSIDPSINPKNSSIALQMTRARARVYSKHQNAPRCPTACQCKADVQPHVTITHHMQHKTLSLCITSTHSHTRHHAAPATDPPATHQPLPTTHQQPPPLFPPLRKPRRMRWAANSPTAVPILDVCHHSQHALLLTPCIMRMVT
jgi:hypothetical protein